MYVCMYLCLYVCMCVCTCVYMYEYICIDIYNIYEKNGCSLNLIEIISFFPVSFFVYLLFFSFYSNKFLVFYSLIKCQNIVGKTCDN